MEEVNETAELDYACTGNAKDIEIFDDGIVLIIVFVFYVRAEVAEEG